MSGNTRYYAECAETRPMFQSRWIRAWQVFDRERRDPDDPSLSTAVALCADRATAFKIRDLLNQPESA